MKPKHIIHFLSLAVALSWVRPTIGAVTEVRRDANSGSQVSTNLSHDVYRTETYQVPYTEQVPYNVEEIYYEQVPYQVEETYKEWEEYWAREKVCHNETTYEEVCNVRRKCTPIFKRICEKKRVCQQDKPSCWKEVCRNVKVGENCKDETFCKKIPKTRKVCRVENVRKQRLVTKTRWVTKYRQERRTRIVTRYREVERCCITKERDVFDHKISASVDLNFPTDATLDQGEVEKFEVSLIETAGQPKVSVKAKQSIYKYSPVVAMLSPSQFSVEMAIVPSYDSGDLGEASIGNLQISKNQTGLLLEFTDAGVVRKVSTEYLISIVDPTTNVTLETKSLTSQKSSRLGIELSTSATVGQILTVNLSVRRTGIVLPSQTDFAVTRQITVADAVSYDTGPYMDKTLVGKFSTEGTHGNFILFFRDLTADIPQVATKYFFRLIVGGNVITEISFARQDLSPNSEGRIPLFADKDLKIAPNYLNLLAPGTTIVIEAEITRQGQRFPGGKFVIPKKVTLEI